MTSIETHARLSRVRRWLWALVAIAALGIGVMLGIRAFGGDQVGTPEVAGAPADIGTSFTLVDRAGKPVTPQSLKGKPYAIFFGFTRCPDVCPTALSRMAQFRKKMGADGDKFQIVFVSVDSGRDSPAEVGAYVDLFGTPILGLTGSEQQIAQATKSFRVFFQKVPVEGGDYTIDHSAFTILMDRDGHFRSLLSDQESEASALAELRRLIA